MKNKPASKQMLFEPMEPRLLLSGGLEGVLATEALSPSAAVLNTPQLEQPATDTLAAGDVQAQEEIRNELVIVDTGVDNYQALVNDLLAGQDNTRRIDLFYLDSDRDGIEQISAILSGYQDLDAVHIISHGDRQELKLGNATLQLDSLAQYRPAISEWNTAFSADADLLFYGCNLAGSDAGTALINELSRLTGTDIAASDDLTGNRLLGGDWDLEYSTGAIETAIAFSSDLQASWSEVLVATKSGTEFQANTYTTSAQDTTNVAMDDNGNFVVTWDSLGQDGGGWGVYGQLYDANGNTVGSEFQVNSTATDTSTQWYNSVAMDVDGDFVVVWESDQNGNFDIYAQRFGADGTSQGTEFQVNTTGVGDQARPDVSMDNNGNFAVVWTSNDGSGDGVYARLFDSTGVPQTGEIQVNSTTASAQNDASVAMGGNGDFVVSWDSFSQDKNNTWGIFAQRFDATGTTVGTEIQVNTTTNGDQIFNDVAISDTGDFVVIWNGRGVGDNTGVHGQLFDATGSTVGSEFLVNTTTGSTQTNAAVAMDSTGNLSSPGKARARTEVPGASSASSMMRPAIPSAANSRSIRRPSAISACRVWRCKPRTRS